MRALPLLLVLLAPLAARAQSENLSLLGRLDPRPQGYADVWGYVGPDGREYALVNARVNGGLSMIDVTGDVLVETDYLRGSVTGSDVEVYGHYAYVSDDAGPVQIVDLSDPTDLAVVGTFEFSVHTVTVVGDHLYVQGSVGIGGVRIYSLADPLNPAFVGEYAPHYVHDILVRGDTLYTAGIWGDGVDIVDLSDKANPVLINRFNYPSSGAHNICTDPSGSYLYVGDEIGAGRWTRIFDVRDPLNVEQVGEIIVDAASTVHNCHVKDGLLYLAHYDRGGWVFDISDPVNPVQVAYYEDDIRLAWSFYPHLPSGKLLLSDMLTGLHVLRLDEPVASEDGPGGSAEIALLPPAPNPFASRTTLAFALPAASRVRLAVYDALGREVAVLVDGERGPGRHEVAFEGAALPAGTYLARLAVEDPARGAGTTVQAQRLTLVR
jgi:choice-of-anchor B domain-containing protein